MYIDFRELARTLPVMIARVNREDPQPGCFYQVIEGTTVCFFNQCLPPVGCKLHLHVNGRLFADIYMEAFAQLGQPEEDEQIEPYSRMTAWHAPKQELPTTEAENILGRKFQEITAEKNLSEAELLVLRQILVIREMFENNIMYMRTWITLIHMCLGPIPVARQPVIVSTECLIQAASKPLIALRDAEIPEDRIH